MDSSAIDRFRLITPWGIWLRTSALSHHKQLLFFAERNQTHMWHSVTFHAHRLTHTVFKRSFVVIPNSSGATEYEESLTQRDMNCKHIWQRRSCSSRLYLLFLWGSSVWNMWAGELSLCSHFSSDLVCAGSGNPQAWFNHPLSLTWQSKPRRPRRCAILGSLPSAANWINHPEGTKLRR